MGVCTNSTNIRNGGRISIYGGKTSLSRRSGRRGWGWRVGDGDGVRV